MTSPTKEQIEAARNSLWATAKFWLRDSDVIAMHEAMTAASPPVSEEVREVIEGLRAWDADIRTTGTGVELLAKAADLLARLSKGDTQ
jgi:hypothetical protein